MQASSDSRLIKCRYYILVQCDLKWSVPSLFNRRVMLYSVVIHGVPHSAPDIKLDLPTTIYNPVPIFVLPPPPPGWAPQVCACMTHVGILLTLMECRVPCPPPPDDVRGERGDVGSLQVRS